jgi:PTH1 family peptidyl-tRNA hydrolase
MLFVVGLGNPGSEYAGTRHNVGFDVLSELAHRWQFPRPKVRFEAEIAEGQIKGQRVLLVAPQTYMNVSGRSVQAVLRFYQSPVTAWLVVCDDLNLKLGQLRLRKDGSGGGQKGLASILTALGTEEVPRLRLGIDRPPAGIDAATYVLGRFRSDEQGVIDQAVRQAASAVEMWVEHGLDATMNAFNAVVTAAEPKPAGPRRDT